MPENSLSIELRVRPLLAIEPDSNARPVDLEITYAMVVTDPAARTETRVSETVRGQLDERLVGTLTLSDVAAESPIEVRLLAGNGATRVTKTLLSGSVSGGREVTLDASEAKRALELPPQPAAETPLVERHAAFIPVAGDSYPWSKYRLRVAVAALLPPAWTAAGLDAVFRSPTPVTTAVELVDDPRELAAFEWTEVHLGVDGRFVLRFPERAGDGFLWWLTGPSSVAGVVVDSLQRRAPRLVAIALPPRASRDGEPTGSEAEPCAGKPVPAGATEAELTNNPAIFSEDPGAFCRPFSNPNRIVSERSFQVILRAEQPLIGPEASVNTIDPPILELDVPVLSAAEAAPTGLVGRVTNAVNSLFASAANSRFVATTRAVAHERMPAGYRSFLHGLDRGRKQPDAKKPLQWEGDASRYQATTVARGHVLEYRVRWRSNGYSLGNVMNTLTLAPRQVKRIQKIEWERAERTRRTERTQFVERVEDSVTRERTYEDEIQASLSEWARGESSASTTAGAAGFGFALPGFVVGGGGVHSQAESQSSSQGGRRTSASEEQRLRDGIRRYADALRRLESTVVQEVTQEETVTGTTEVVRNQNYAHSLTVIYYQILRHLRVDTEFAAVRECLFVPFAIRPFTVARAHRWREAIARALRDRRHAGAVDNLGVVLTNFQGSDIPTGRRSEQPVRHLSGSLFVRLGIERPKDGAEDAFDAAAWNVLRPLLGFPALAIHARLKKLLAEQRDRAFQEEHAPRIAASWADSLMLEAGGQPLPADFTLASRYQFNGVVRIDFSAPIPANLLVTRETLASLKLSTQSDLPPGSVANLTRMSFKYQTDAFQRSVGVDTGENDLVSVETGEHDALGATASAPPDAWELRDLRAEVARGVSELVAHLNEHVEHYHKAIWWNMDRDRLYMLLDGAYVPRTNGVSVASVVERDPIAILGNCLVFRVTSGAFLGMDGVKTPEALYEYYASRQGHREPMHVSLPNDGVYAQTIMDECEGLEEHFGNTDWALSETEPDLGTIAPELLGSRRAEPPGATPSAFPQTIINLQNAPDAPAPTGLGAALEAVGNANAFRDMAGLAGTQENVRAGITAATGLAQSFGNQAAALRLAEMAKNADAAKNADRKIASIERAKDKGLVDDATAREQAQTVLSELSGTAAARMHEDTPLFEAVRSAMGKPGSTIEANGPDGSLRVALASSNEREGEDASGSTEAAGADESEEVKDGETWSILVAGYNYANPSGGGSKTYGAYARNRAELLLGKHPGMRFLLLNVGEGKAYVDQASKGKLRHQSNWRAIDRLRFAGTTNDVPLKFRAINHVRDYTGVRFRYPVVQAGGVDLTPGTEPEPIMSILHFYGVVRAFGREMAGQVFEASVLSHGQPGGPILVNSFRAPAFVHADALNMSDLDRPRDPADLDGRADRDFTTPTNDPTALGELKQAFTSDGHFWIWGCSADPVTKRLILRLTQQAGYKADGSNDDLVDFDFNFESQSQIDDYKDLYGDQGIFPASGTTTRKSLGAFRAFMQLIVEGDYAFRLASGTGIPCFGTATGTGSEPDVTAALPVHAVPAIYERVVNFFEKYMGCPRDPEGRRYVEYSP